MKELTLEEVRKKQKYYSNKLRELHNKEQQLICSSYNYEKSYIHYPNYGYMYVTWQTTEGDNVLLQGIAFTSEKTMYRDACYLDFDALKEWRIPMRTFREDSERGDIKIITSQEFNTELHKAFNGFLDLASEHIKHVTITKNKKNGI